MMQDGAQDAPATQRPVRKSLTMITKSGGAQTRATRPSKSPGPLAAVSEESLDSGNGQTTPDDVAGISPPPLADPGPREQHFTILYGDTGHSYESIVSPYLPGAKEIVVEDPYIRMTHQVQNFVRFCEAVTKHSAIRKIRLVTGYDDNQQVADTKDKLDDLQQSLLEMDVALEVQFREGMHDREIRLDNGWVIKIGRGLDFYQKPGTWFDIGASDLSLRKCLETKVDIFRDGR